MDLAYLEDLIYYGKYDTALSLIERELEKGEKSPELLLLKGICQRERGELNEALNSFNEAEKMGMENVKRLYHEIAMTYLKMGKGTEAISTLKKIEDPEIMLEESDIMEIMGNVEEAEDLVERSIMAKPSLNGYLKKAFFLVRKGKIQESISTLKQANDERASLIANFLDIVINGREEERVGSPNFIPWLIGNSISKALKGDLEGAIKDSERAVSIDPYSPLLHTVYGSILFLHGDQRASEELEKGREWKDPTVVKENVKSKGIRFLTDEIVKELTRSI